MAPLDPLELLRRPDKWYLAGGRGVTYDPPFPSALEVPGFWDTVHVADVGIDRLFTVFLRRVGDPRPLPLVPIRQDWRPDRLRIEYVSAGGELGVMETRTILECGAVVSELELRPTDAAGGPIQLDVFLWSLLDDSRECETVPDRVGQWVRRAVATPDGYEVEVGVRQRYQTHPTGTVPISLGADHAPDARVAARCQTTATAPLWHISVFPEKLRDGFLSGEMLLDVGPGDPNALLHLGLQWRLLVPAGDGATIRCMARLSVRLEPERVSLPSPPDPVRQAEDEWRRYFDGVPQFDCSDPFLRRYYWYRWYGLRLCTVEAESPPLGEPCVFEGIDYFRRHISYSAPCHALETRWMADPRLARGSILNFTRSQQPDGSFPAYVCAFWVGPQEFYHADWGTAVLAVNELHPERDFLAEVYEPLTRYADYFDRVRDPERTGLYDVINQDETGQEYAPRYLFADAEADRSTPIRLKGVDATVYLYRLKRALEHISRELGTGEEARWAEEADRTREAVRRHLWCSSMGLFVDARVPDLAQSPHRSAVGFYPLATDMVDGEQQERLIATLLDPSEFGAPWPVPSASMSDPLFSPHAEWKGMRMRCPWNGRVWPMTNSHICDAVATAADRDPALRPVAAGLIRRFVELMFWDGDPSRPNCFEHYNPFTGEPCAYRGIDDYQHSWVVDLILKYVAGVRPQPDGRLMVDPLPFGLAYFHALGVPWKGRRIDVSWQSDSGRPTGELVVRVNGDVVGRRRDLGRIEVA